jgi:hypothetical protein
MKAFLMYRDCDFDLQRELPPNEVALTQDLELSTLFEAMALGDKFLLEVAKKAVLTSLNDVETILYRQHVLQDCLEQPSVVRRIYDLAVEGIESERKVWRSVLTDYPDTTLHRSVEVLRLFVGVLKRLRQVADEHAAGFRSEGFARFFAMVSGELADGYFQTIDSHLKELGLRRGVLMSARLGKGNKGIEYVLRKPPEQTWMERLSVVDRTGYSFHIADRDESGAKALTELRGRGVNLVANALAQSVDHILSFFHMLRTELAFYIGCLNLQGRLAEKGEPACFPIPLAPGEPALSARGLYDVCLTLKLEARAVGNDVDADGKWLVMITGANQGGKSTFLRSVGLAQLMMQCGMFVPAESFRANICSGVFTHYKREEDAAMKGGKLDEELSRMAEIASRITPHGMVLCNESFASTNEREGAEIARQIVRALTEARIKVLYVTHLFDLAHGFYREQQGSALFLRAERQSEGRRTFKLREGEPLPTSHGEDLYERIFGMAPDAVPAHAGPGACGGRMGRER